LPWLLLNDPFSGSTDLRFSKESCRSIASTTDAGGDARDRTTDPFLALMEDRFPRGVFGKHLHGGIDTVTYVVEGRIDHCDNQGHEGTILPGDVRWMTAGAI
jgi:redox-sensitive bicupin YhaK (pirin superfamily)